MQIDRSSRKRDAIRAPTERCVRFEQWVYKNRLQRSASLEITRGHLKSAKTHYPIARLPFPRDRILRAGTGRYSKFKPCKSCGMLRARYDGSNGESNGKASRTNRSNVIYPRTGYGGRDHLYLHGASLTVIAGRGNHRSGVDDYAARVPGLTSWALDKNGRCCQQPSRRL
jgi:hypothetical protein